MRYAAGEEGSARKVAAELGPNVGVEQDASVRSGQVQVFVGTDYQAPANNAEDVDAQGAPGTTAPGSSSSTPPITAGGLVCVN
ncbi:MAG: hypothetical protein HOV94_14150 [Saccharothrix sp.]|nr:hypothetical protein [Saccharothrix sp.]